MELISLYTFGSILIADATPKVGEYQDVINFRQPKIMVSIGNFSKHVFWAPMGGF